MKNKLKVSRRIFNPDFLFLVCFFSLIALPNFTIGVLSVNITDILVICMLIKNIFSKRSKFCGMIKSYIVFVIFVFISLVINSIIKSTFNITNYLKATRLFCPAVIYIYFNKYVKSYTHSKSIIYSFIFAVFIGGFLSLLIFASQTTYFGIDQTMIIFGKVLYRNGGVYGDANTLSIMFAFEMLALTFFLFGPGKNDFKSTFFIIIDILICVLNLLFSYSRTGIFTVAIGLCIGFCFSKMKCSKKIITATIVLLLGFSFINLNTSINKIILERLFSSGNNLNDYSSGRIQLWTDILKDLSRNNLITALFGNGFKNTWSNGLITFYACDNNFLYVLVSTGITGLLIYLVFLFYFLKKILMIKKKSIAYSLLYSLIFLSMFLDVVTIYKFICLVFFLYIMFYSLYPQKEHPKERHCNEVIRNMYPNI